MNIITICSDKLNLPQVKSGGSLSSVRIFSDMPLQYFGGGEKSIIDLSNYIHSKGFEVKIFQENSNSETRVSFEEIQKITPAKITIIKYNKHFPRFLYQEMPSVSEFRNNELNLIYLYRIPPRRYLRKLRRLDVPIIFCIYGISTVIPSLSLKFFFFNLYTKFSLNYFSKFISSKSKIMVQVLTKTTEELLYSMGADKKHVFRIASGVDFNNYAVAQNNDRFVVIFVGRMVNTQKGIDRLAKVVSKLPTEVNISIIGSGPDSWILNSALPENVDFLGFISEEKKCEKLREANLLILTSNSEPFGLVILEGLAAGLPCVATPVEGSLEILMKNQIFGTISSFNPDDFAREIIRYFEEWKKDKDCYFQNKIKRRETAKKYYDLSIMMEKYYEMFVASSDTLKN
jgi:glycosyltransferase involved in cell wall biosynthesis